VSQPKVITLSPNAADANGISTQEDLAAARLDFLINGALSSGYDADGIATAQTTSGATALTLDGALGTDFRDRRGTYILIEDSDGNNNTGITFAVVGEDINGNRITETITGPGASLIVLGSTKFYHVTSVTPSGAVTGNVTVGVNGYVDFTSTPQHVEVTSAGNDSGLTFTPRGYDRYGNEVTDSITGGNAGASTNQDVNFAWVDRVTASAATDGVAGAEVGVDGLCESGWYLLNYRGPDFNVAIGCDIGGGTMTYSIQHTFDNVLASGFVENDATVFTHSTLSGETTNQDGNYTNPPRAMRAAITAHTSGTLTTTVVHAGRS
jgi:hypothetical protein